jgi:hypothetical protein
MRIQADDAADRIVTSSVDNPADPEAFVYWVWPEKYTFRF